MKENLIIIFKFQESDLDMQCDSDEEEVDKPSIEKKTEIQTPPKSEPIKQCVLNIYIFLIF